MFLIYSNLRIRLGFRNEVEATRSHCKHRFTEFFDLQEGTDSIWKSLLYDRDSQQPFLNLPQLEYLSQGYHISHWKLFLPISFLSPDVSAPFKILGKGGVCSLFSPVLQQNIFIYFFITQFHTVALSLAFSLFW